MAELRGVALCEPKLRMKGYIDLKFGLAEPTSSRQFVTILGSGKPDSTMGKDMRRSSVYRTCKCMSVVGRGSDSDCELIELKKSAVMQSKLYSTPLL